VQRAHRHDRVVTRLWQRIPQHICLDTGHVRRGHPPGLVENRRRAIQGIDVFRPAGQRDGQRSRAAADIENLIARAGQVLQEHAVVVGVVIPVQRGHISGL
jgi:hypothetical protein